MKQTLKKALSLLMMVAILCSFAVIPASAAGTVTIGLENGSWDGDKYTVDVVASGDDFKVASVEIDVKFDPAVLTWVSNDGGYSGGVLATVQEGNTVHAVGMSATDVASSGGKLVLVGLTFQVAADAETQDTSLEVVVDDALFGDVASESPALSAASPLSVHVTGQPPMLDSVVLEESSVEVNGRNVTVSASAKSTKGATINGAVDWTITPASDDVSINNGVITVSGTAKPATYTVTATPKSGEARGDEKTATLTVTRAAAEVTTVEITNGSTFTIPKTGSSTLTFAADVKDQFGDLMNETVTWNVTASAETGLTIDGNKVTVSSEAVKDTTITATATAGGKTGSKTVRLVNIELTVTPKAGAAYGDTWSEILPVSGVSAKMGDAALTVTSVTRAINGSNVDAVKPAAGSYTVAVTAVTSEGEATIEVPVTVAKRNITVELDNQVHVYNGEAFTAGTMTAEGDVDGETLTCVPVEEVTETDAGIYPVEYTCESDNYNVTVKGGALEIQKKSIQVNGKLILSLKFNDTSTFVRDENGVVTKITSQISAGDYTRLEDLKKALTDANKGVVFTVETDDGESYNFSISNWELISDGDYNSNRGTYTFAPVVKGSGAEAVDFLRNHELALPEMEVTIKGGSSGGGSAGGGSGSFWGDRGNQTITMTPKLAFTDVPDGYTFLSDITWVYYRGIMKGTSDTTFSPTNSTNRQQLWMVLGRLSGSNPSSMAMAREWAVNTGVSDGTNATGSLTRQQMVTMLYRWAQSKGYTGVTTGSIAGYNDASSVASYARDAMAWAVGNGIISGSANNLMPNGTATRAQFAAIMHRFCEKFGV